MKFALTYLTILFISFSAVAKVESYSCYVADPTKGHEIFSEASVPFEDCTLTPVSAAYDICKVNGHTLIVGVDAHDSLVITSTGQTYEFICQEYEDGTDPVQTPAPAPVPPTNTNTPPENPEQPPRPQQQQQQQQHQQQQQQQREGPESPGMGGSNIRGRGIIIY